MADDDPVLPDYEAAQFALADAPECDAIMKGGITSGVVYPYAVLEIATKYRFRAVGGTSAGAIAAAFTAAAEYARGQGRPEGFVTLKHYCDQLPDILFSLFQPSPALKPSLDSAQALIASGGPGMLIRRAALAALPWALLGAAILAVPSYLLAAGAYATALAALLGFLLGFAIAIFLGVRRNYVRPLAALWRALPAGNFGFCTGLTQAGSGGPALTDWLHRALQHIAFGDPDAARPLTFGDLGGPDPNRPLIDLKVVTTNLSMRRPHTLPRLGVAAAFVPDQWRKLFPEPVVDHLCAVSEDWEPRPGARTFPLEADLPVVVAVRMSLSFPLLFTAVPLEIEDLELPSIVKSLGGKAAKPVRTAYFSDGGISSNFPIHMFDSMLPGRPTFAFSLEELLCDPDEVTRRVALPASASEGMGVQISQIGDLKAFAWAILNSAKDWQDQLLSGISGQRERIARIYLTETEGGLNLGMPPDLSRRLMMWGYEAGRKFTSGQFDFDEHKWRRLLVLYKNLRRSLEQADASWSGGFDAWYDTYLSRTKSYNELTLKDKQRIAKDLRALFAACATFAEEPVIRRLDEKLPRRSGIMKVGPKY